MLKKKYSNKSGLLALILLTIFAATQGIPSMQRTYSPHLITAKETLNNRPITASAVDISASENELQVNHTNNITETDFRNITSNMSKSTEVVDLIKNKLELEELIKSNPELINQIPSLLLDADYSGRAKLALIHSLQQIANDQSKQLLTDIIKDKQYGHHEKMQAIISVGDLSTPTDKNIKALWDTYTDSDTPEDMRSSAILNLGISAASSFQTNREISEETINKLSELLYSSPANSQKQVIIESLGNSESPRTLEIVKPFLKSEDSGIRAAAAYALRYTNSQQADNLLLSSIEKDPSSAVRASAVDALNLTNASAEKISKISNLLFTEEDSTVRLAIIRLIGVKGQNYQAANEALRAQLSLESDPLNYENIIEMLHSS